VLHVLFILSPFIQSINHFSLHEDISYGFKASRFVFPFFTAFCSFQHSWFTPLPSTLMDPVYACPCTAPFGLCSVWPIQSHLLSFTFCSIGVCFVLCHNSLFEILSEHLKFKIRFKRRFTNPWSKLLTRFLFNITLLFL
jgi:hypothetical protein